MPVIRLSTTDPYVNLAIEERILERAEELGPTLMLWRNEPCVVIGRHQNPWVECDLAAMRRDALPLVRRISGGGAVYHDGGNTNFSFIAPSKADPPHAAYDQERHFRVVIDGLARLGIEAWKTDRNDLRVGERKISGNAFRHTRGRSLHHGTLLVNANLDLLTAYLSPSGALIETKATPSVRSTVMNLVEVRPDVTHEMLWDAIAEAFDAEYGGGGAAPAEAVRDRTVAGAAAAPNDAEHHAAADVAERAAELASWEWVYGHTPTFVRRLGMPPAVRRGGDAETPAEIAITVKKGRIVEVTSSVSGLADALIGLRYEQSELERAAGEVRTDGANAGEGRLATAMDLVARSVYA